MRNGPYDFKPKSRDGLGFDWPISYEDVAPYYDKVESLIGVFGSNEGLENTPNSPEGILLPPPKMRASELLFHKTGKKLGIPVIPTHRAVLSQRLNSKKIPKWLHPNNPAAQRILAEQMGQRLACFWSTYCTRGCSIKANYQSTTVHLPPALATGNLDIITNAMAREVEIDRYGKATGVNFIDKTTGLDYIVKSRLVVLAASACESVRILLNSESALFPNGLANSSGLLDFPRGYHIETGNNNRMPSVASMNEIGNWIQGSYGKKLKEEARRYYGSFVAFRGRGEMVPNEDCFCEIDRKVNDRWGIPVLKFHWKWGEPELRQAAHMQKIFAEIVTEMKGSITTEIDTTGKTAIYKPGRTIHEVGGAIMGLDRSQSVTNRHSQTWDVPNLFITDGAPFCSNADKNPTLTIMALAWRAADFMMESMKKGDV